MSNSTKGKLSLVGLALMIFTSVFGFGNIPVAFYQMGYGAIPWYVIGALLFFIPFAFMATEMGSAFKDEKGGIYSWMERAVNPTFAFVGTFMWYCAYVIWMVTVSSKILLPIVNLIWGNSDHMPSIFWLSISAIIWMALVTLAISKGMETIKKFTSFAGGAVLALNIILILGAVLVLILNGHPATEITAQSFVSSPNPNFDGSAVSFIAFLVFAIFAYGGLEAIAGLVDQTENPKKNFPRGILISAIVVAVGYSVAILSVGFFTNYTGDWLPQIKNGTMNLGTVPYMLMQNLGLEIGHSLNLSHETSIFIGGIFARYIGLSMFLAYMGAFFTLTYSPLKQTIMGTPEKLWPGKIGKLDKDGLPKIAMWIQFVIVSVIILLNLITTGKGGSSNFFLVLTNMANVSMTLPYILIVTAYWFFKKDQTIEKPIVFLKSHTLASVLTVLVLIVIIGANFFTIISPIVSKSPTAVADVTSMLAGPVVFGLIAYFMMKSYERKVAQGKLK